MNIIIGSLNPAKVKAVQEVFPEASISQLDADSGVSRQPFSDEETKRGAINRALACMNITPSPIAIGLEGGVMFIGNQLFLCNWGALVTPEQKVYAASGARILLPLEITEQLLQGKELGDIMDNYVKRYLVRKKEGAVGIFTNERITRQKMFAHVVELLRGQWEYENR
ncbi:DUF84 family protein [Cerasibacillus sp. JNUCC 74]